MIKAYAVHEPNPPSSMCRQIGCPLYCMGESPPREISSDKMRLSPYGQNQ